MTPARTVLEVKALTKRFGGLVAVEDMSFDVQQHEVLGIIGPNGSGKSTTMNLISGALRATSGRIILEGRELTALPAQQIARLGVARTFQLVRVLPKLSVIENVIAGAAFSHKPAGVPRRINSRSTCSSDCTSLTNSCSGLKR